jgi:hypothetical protein
MRSAENKALCYVVFSTPLLLSHSWAQICSLALYSQIVLVSDIHSLSHSKKKTVCKFC